MVRCVSATRWIVTTCCGASCRCSTPATTWPSPAAPSGFGDTVEIIPMYEELAVRIEFFGDEIDKLYTLHPVTGRGGARGAGDVCLPASHYIAGPERMERAISGIERELADQLSTFEKQGKLLEAQRLRMRTTYDIEMMRQVGSCSGIENYSMHLDGRTREVHRTACSTTSPRTSCSSSTSPHHRAPDRCDVRRRHVAQADARRAWLPAALGDGQPTFEVGGVPRTDRADGLPLGHARQLRAGQGRRHRRADHPPDRPDRPGDHPQADQGPDRRPVARDPDPRGQE